MKRNGLTKRMAKDIVNLVNKQPEYSTFAPLLLSLGSPLQKLDFLAFTLNETPKNDPAHTVVEMIQSLVTTPPSKKDWIKGKKQTIVGSPPFYPSPGSPLYLFNELAMWNPFCFKIEGYENNTGTIEIHASQRPIPHPALWTAIAPGGRDKVLKDWMAYSAKTGEILRLLWEIYFQKIGLDRLKCCPQCQKWFVDRTRNNKKERCSMRCTWKWWSWRKRKEEGHKQPKVKKKRRRKKSQS